MQEQVYKTEAGDTWDLIAFKLFGKFQNFSSLQFIKKKLGEPSEINKFQNFSSLQFILEKKVGII